MDPNDGGSWGSGAIRVRSVCPVRVLNLVSHFLTCEMGYTHVSSLLIGLCTSQHTCPHPRSALQGTKQDTVCLDGSHLPCRLAAGTYHWPCSWESCSCSTPLLQPSSRCSWRPRSSAPCRALSECCNLDQKNHSFLRKGSKLRFNVAIFHILAAFFL